MCEEISKWIEKAVKPISSGTWWFDTFDDDEGEPCLRTWALHVLKNKPYQVKEVIREYWNKGLFIHGDLYFCGAAGYKVNWGNRKGHSYYMPSEEDNTWYPIDMMLRPGISTIRLFKNDKLNSIFKKYVPYFQMSEPLNIMEYARRYKEFSSAELLAKAGFEYLVMDKRVLKLSKASKKKLVRWLMIPENNDYVKVHHPVYNDISRAIKKNWSMDKYYYEQAIDRYEVVFKNARIKRTREECMEVYDYLNGRKKHPMQKVALHTYIDYLGMAKEEGMDMKAKSTLYPLDCARAHDTLVTRRNIKESKEINEKLSKIYEKLTPYQISKKDLKIVFPKNQKDFVEWGKKLHICVGSYDYDKKMSKGECIITMVYLNDQPLECCELRKKPSGRKLEIIQLRGEYNQDSERHEECEALINKFIKVYKPVEVSA